MQICQNCSYNTSLRLAVPCNCVLKYNILIMPEFIQSSLICVSRLATSTGYLEVHKVIFMFTNHPATSLLGRALRRGFFIVATTQSYYECAESTNCDELHAYDNLPCDDCLASRACMAASCRVV